ncbi:MAG: class I SAM-dependent methyltransferase [Actinomycetota bacterium]
MSTRVCLWAGDGSVVPLHRERWLGPATVEEGAVLDRAVAPVLDVGCGPGRHLLALAARGICALGVDVASNAVRIASTRGALVLHRSIFDPLPGEGRWASALLMDGNIGIGGDPEALLRRLRQLLRRGGRVLVEVEEPGTPTGPVWLRVHDGTRLGPSFPWARVSADRLSELARRTGFHTIEQWNAARRWFAALERR